MINIKFNGWEVVAYSSEVEHHSIKEMLTVFISRDNEYYFIHDELDKIRDVIGMPNYISDDWVNYNKKEVNEKILDKYIKEFSEVGLMESQYIASELKSIKRNLIIKKII